MGGHRELEKPKYANAFMSTKQSTEIGPMAYHEQKDSSFRLQLNLNLGSECDLVYRAGTLLR